MPREKLVTRQMLEKLVDHSPGNQEYEAYLKTRWVGMVMWWHKQSILSKWMYFSLRALIIVGGVLIPVVTTVNVQVGLPPHHALVIAAVIGAVVAACTAWEGVKNYGETWREKRRAAELLKVEGWLFLFRCGKYAFNPKAVKEGGDPKDVQTHKLGKHAAFDVFVTQVESMIAREVGQYLDLFAPSVEQARQAAANIQQAIDETVNARQKGSSGGAG